VSQARQLNRGLTLVLSGIDGMRKNRSMTGTPRKHHYVTAGYVKRFADPDSGMVETHHYKKGAHQQGARGFGYRKDFWGGRELATILEQAFNRCETPALDLLRGLDNSRRTDTLTGDERALISEFMALHVVRLPGFRRLIASATEDAVREVLSQNPRAGRRERQEAARVFGSTDSQADAMVGRVGVLTGVLASMHWSLVEFERAWLITGDQPVVFLPRKSGSITPEGFIPPEGIFGTSEARFTLDPYTALLMTWHDDCDPSTTHAGTFEQACSLNMAVRSRAAEEWVCRPGTHPPFVKPPFLWHQIHAISADVIPGYPTSDSVRRNRAEQWVKDGSYEKVHWVAADSAARTPKSVVRGLR
jgi:hypothetical protein